MGHHGFVKAVLHLRAARVHHGQQGHAPVVAGFCHPAQIGQHEAFVGVAQVYMYGNAVRAVLEGFFYRAHQGFGVGVGGKGRGGRKVDDQADIAARAAVAATHQAFVHEHARLRG